MTSPPGSPFVRRLVTVAPGSPRAGTAGPAGELWFVIGGRGRLDVPGQAGVRLDADRGLWVPPATKFRIYAATPADLHLDIVTLPAGSSGPDARAAGQAADSPADPGPAAPQARDLRDCAVERTGDRRFRVLFGPGRGCAVATQFVGEIPAGRAPEHSHPYDELVLILDGTGVLHAGGTDHPLSAGATAHLPPGLPHCLENTGPATMRVLGVFHPADSPAAKTPAGAEAGPTADRPGPAV
jgi:quercetin dioxygenase-like cupin family protein